MRFVYLFLHVFSPSFCILLVSHRIFVFFSSTFYVMFLPLGSSSACFCVFHNFSMRKWRSNEVLFFAVALSAVKSLRYFAYTFFLSVDVSLQP